MYTRHYWDVLCKDVLGFPLHHGPSLGGQAEATKFRDWYGRTLQSYAAAFGEPPPIAFWPAPADRFRCASHASPITADSHWIIRKPQWLKRIWPTALMALSWLLIACPTLALANSSTDKHKAADGLAFFLSVLGGFAIFSFGRWLTETPEERAARLKHERERREQNRGCGGGCGSSGCGGGCGGCGG